MARELRLKKIIRFGAVMLSNQIITKSFFGMYEVVNMRVHRKAKCLYSGDTGYSPDLFKAIGNLYSPFTLAAIPIGSFMPTHLMQHLHMGPEDAIKAHYDLGCPQLSVGIHWGTFMMSDEHYLAPRQVLERVWENYTPQIDEAIEDDQTSIASSSSSTIVANSGKKLTNFVTTAFGQTVVLN